MGKRLEQELIRLRQRVATMANSVQQALADSVAALRTADIDAANRVCEADVVINDQRFALESDIVTVIATQQPVAGDVRLLVGILEIATELERMGDYAKDIGRIAIRQHPHKLDNLPFDISEISGHAINMLERAITAFVDGNPELATTVAKDDDHVDNLCLSLHRKLVQDASSDGASLQDAMRLLPAIHNIERFADRVTNICERIVYIETSQQVEFDDL